MDPNTVLLFAKINFIAFLILAGFTAYYAISTHRILKEMKHQSKILAKSLQVSINIALTGAAGHPAGENPYQELRSLLKELEKCSGVT